VSNTLLEGVCIRRIWIWRKFYACLWQLSLSVIRSTLTILM